MQVCDRDERATSVERLRERGYERGYKVVLRCAGHGPYKVVDLLPNPTNPESNESIEEEKRRAPDSSRTFDAFDAQAQTVNKNLNLAFLVVVLVLNL